MLARYVVGSGQCKAECKQGEASERIELLQETRVGLINYFFIPTYSYMACAWATFLCYGSMMVISYIWGQKEYRIPYAWKKLLAYMVIVALLYFIHHSITSIWPNYWLNLGLATVLTLGFAIFILRVDKKEFERIPYIGGLI